MNGTHSDDQIVMSDDEEFCEGCCNIEKVVIKILDPKEVRNVQSIIPK